MNIYEFISEYQQNLDSRIHPLRRVKKIVLIASLVALSCLVFSFAWAGDYTYANAPEAHIHLTGLSIVIGPRGFRLGIGEPSYGRAYLPYVLWCLLLNLIGNNQGISAIITTMWHLHGLTVVLGGKTMDQ